MSDTNREQWGSRIGLILAVAGNAVGLGNFLRFPVQAASNGGGAFMIPYFIAFLLLGIPLMWIEWAIGRHGGKYGHSSAPGMFHVLWNHPVAKYIGSIGMVISTSILIYYTYIESWTLGYSIFSMIGLYWDVGSFKEMTNFLASYQGLTKTAHFSTLWPAYLLMIITFVINFYVLWRGLSAGIEKLAKIAMPLLFIFAVILVVRVFTIDVPDPSHPENNVWAGLNYIWNPDFSLLSDAKVWLAAAGQIFFTLSVGMGTIHAYASYLRPKNDIALSGLTTAVTNESAEVILGGSIAIPAAVAFFGIPMTQAIASGGAFDLGFVSMPLIFTKIPMGQMFGALWFLLLFFAGITSSVAMAQPTIAFLKDEFGFTHRRATIVLGVLVLLLVQPVVLFFGHGFLDEMDYWAGTFGLVVFALLETIIFAWVFGIDNAWNEITSGADIKVPVIFKHIIKYITPAYLIIILVYWTITEAIPTLLLESAPAEDIPYMWGARILMLSIFVAFILLAKKAFGKTSVRAM